MPIYEYRCLNCKHDFEVMQKFSDAPVGVCPKCNGPVKKKVSNTTFQLKGSGWYMTDYAKKNSPPVSKDHSESSSSSTTTETKPDSSKPASSKPDAD